MSSISSRSYICIALFFLAHTASSRNIHRHHQLHREWHRQYATPTSATTSCSTDLASSPTLLNEKALLHEAHAIEKHLHHLPKEVFRLIHAAERRIADLEKLINNLRSPASLTASSSLSTSTEQLLTNVTPIPASTTNNQASSPTSTGSVSLCYAPDGATGMVPCRSTSASAISVPTSPITGYENRTAGVTGISSAPSTTSPAVPNNSSTGSGGVPRTLQYASQSSSAVINGTTALPSNSSSTTSAFYSFNPQATDNVAVYYGQTPDTQAKGVLELCQDVNVDIVILAFVYDFFSSGGYPSGEFGPACWASQSPQAPYLANCTALAPEIAGCQQIGKKVLVSLGGAVGDSSLGSDTQAEQFATTLWNLFGAGTNDTDLRPFGPDIVVDGFDIDNENHNTAYYDTFATALRQQFAQDPNKTYYLSAAPQCPMPDASIPVGLMYEADFVWVQFYNNPGCELGSNGFASSFAAWSANLSAGSMTPGRPRLYIGAPGAPAGAGSGYVSGANLSSVTDQALALNVSNLGGILLWDGSEALANVDSSGVNYLQYAKTAFEL